MDRTQNGSELKKIINTLNGGKWFIIIVTLIVTVLVAAYFKIYTKPQYMATMSIIPEEESINYNGTKTVGMANPTVTQAYAGILANIISSDTVAEKASKELHGKISSSEIQNSIAVSGNKDTPLLEVSVVGRNPNEVLDEINAVYKAFSEESNRIYPSEKIQLIDKAKLPNSPINQNSKRNVALACFMTLVFSTAIVFLRDYLIKLLK